MKSNVPLLSTHCATLLAGAEDTTTSPDVQVMNVRGQALGVIRGITDMNGALAWRALTTRCAPNTATRVQSLMSAPAELTGIDFRGPFHRVNVEKPFLEQRLFIGASPTSDAESGMFRSGDSSDSSPAKQRTISSRRDSDA